MAEGGTPAQFYGFGTAPVPISMAVRAGDFVYTCTLGDHFFDPEDMEFDEAGNVVSDGSGVGERSIEEETHGVFRNVEAALASAGCTLADVVDMAVWVTDPRDFPAMNRVYATYFTRNRPTRSVFQVGFMIKCRVEMRAVAYKPLGGSPA